MLIAPAQVLACFSPLAGISFAERLILLLVLVDKVQCFSPLAGISFAESQETLELSELLPEIRFQSPCGD